MSDSPAFALFVLKRATKVGLKGKTEILTSALLSWLSYLPPALSLSYYLQNVRSRIETHLAPYKSPLAHVDTMTAPFVDSIKLKGVEPPMPECWGHRGASAVYPENTIASFERAIRDGSEGLESDVHITSDDVIIMFHDPSLERTTDGKGKIHEQRWSNGIEHLRTTQEPRQQIPTFQQVCDLLMMPENMHVKLNIDIKPDNNPERLFRLMKSIVESYPNFAADLSPRLILGLWHPVFLNAALEHVPTLRRIHIGASPTTARTYFWKDCDGFSMWFPSLVTQEGQNFIQHARKEGKDVFVWTVNRRDEMVEATRWGVKAILTDKTDLLHDLRKNMAADYVTTRSEQVGFFFRWATWRYYSVPQFFIQTWWIAEVENRAGITFKSAYGTPPKVSVKTLPKEVQQAPVQDEIKPNPYEEEAVVAAAAITSLPPVVSASA